MTPTQSPSLLLLLLLLLKTLTLVVITLQAQLCLSLTTDGLALLSFKSATTHDPTGALTTWVETDPTPCHWRGVTCIAQRVTSLSLPNKSLSGYLPSELGLLTSLTRLSLSHNNLSSTIPSHLFNAASLRSLDLSHNSLSGSVPYNIRNLLSLSHLDLSSNLFNGSLPESLTELKSLTGTLNLSYNHFSGEIPTSYGQFPVLVSLDLQHNNLSGKVPLVGSLVNQGPTAFSGNPSLCGFPLQNPCLPVAVNISANPVNPKQDPGDGMQREKKRTGSVAVLLVSGVSVVIGVVSVSVWLIRRKLVSSYNNDANNSISGSEKGKMGKEEKSEYYEMSEEGQKGKFVIIDEGFNLELEDLLRASAYVVGKSRSGIVYKVVVGGGGSGGGGRSGAVVPTVVAVRRLSEGDATWKFKEFEAEVEAIGRVHHPNVVRLRAYYYAHDEKLVVSDFVRNESLWTALHGGPSSTLPPLAWAVRLKIAQGTARGLMYIHEHSPRKYVHGNLKTTKILLDDELQPFISGFGLTRLVCGSAKSAPSTSRKQFLNQANFYLAPEARVTGAKFTQKCDVYSFGIILMELLTGKLPDAGMDNDGEGLENFVRKAFRDERPMSEIIDPSLLSEVHAKKQVIAVFHIALNCTELDPELRPRMRMVSDSLDRVKMH